MPSGNKSTPFSLCPLLFSLPYPSLKPRQVINPPLTHTLHMAYQGWACGPGPGSPGPPV